MLVRSMRVRVVVHGHHHDASDSRASWTAQGFASRGVGLRGLIAVDADGHTWMVLPGELNHIGRERGERSQRS